MDSLLVLGGSRFVGRHIAEAAVNAGWTVTVLNNDSGPKKAPAGTQHIFVNRLDPDAMAHALKGMRWDAVVDTWQGHPEAVVTASRILRDSVAIYCLVSSVTVYSENARPPITESTECRTSETDDPNVYSIRKRSAESMVLEAFPKRSLILRPGLIVGPWEYAGRLPWWLLRMQDRRTILAPGPTDRRLQWVDARDFASFVVLCLSIPICDIVNVAGPSEDLTMSQLLRECTRVVGSEPEICWIDSSQLLQSGVLPWIEIPLWIPPNGSHASAYDVSAVKADQIGIRYRTTRQTVEDVWQWMNQLGRERLLRYLDTRVWLDRARETQLLATFK